MPYNFRLYQKQEMQKDFLKFTEYIEDMRMVHFREKERQRIQEYMKRCSEYVGDRNNTDRRFRLMLDNKRQVHEKEEMSRSVCMKI